MRQVSARQVRLRVGRAGRHDHDLGIARQRASPVEGAVEVDLHAQLADLALQPVGDRLVALAVGRPDEGVELPK